MGVRSYTAEFESPVAPSRLFNASVLHLHEIASKIEMPTLVKGGVVIVEGDGGVGTIKEYHFPPVYGDSKPVRERVEELDKENFMCKCSVVEGGTKGIGYKSASNKVSFEATANGGSVCKLVGEFEELEGLEYTEEELSKRKEGKLATYKAVDAYLQANPSDYA
ncbi:hypothetical protein Syun_003200 [Stephania yunnanensis]|uniref:Bet v I/Major latex protein domain-containing protein n=1 Tax=Stephania yunnanensis TaxID=152371 RepID=A0AAP0L0S6_9MAGN